MASRVLRQRGMSARHRAAAVLLLAVCAARLAPLARAQTTPSGKPLSAQCSDAAVAGASGYASFTAALSSGGSLVALTGKNAATGQLEALALFAEPGACAFQAPARLPAPSPSGEGINARLLYYSTSVASKGKAAHAVAAGYKLFWEVTFSRETPAVVDATLGAAWGWNAAAGAFESVGGELGGGGASQGPGLGLGSFGLKFNLLTTSAVPQTASFELATSLRLSADGRVAQAVWRAHDPAGLVACRSQGHELFEVEGGVWTRLEAFTSGVFLCGGKVAPTPDAARCKTARSLGGADLELWNIDPSGRYLVNAAMDVDGSCLIRVQAKSGARRGSETVFSPITPAGQNWVMVGVEVVGKGKYVTATYQNKTAGGGGGAIQINYLSGGAPQSCIFAPSQIPPGASPASDYDLVANGLASAAAFKRGRLRVANAWSYRQADGSPGFYNFVVEFKARDIRKGACDGGVLVYEAKGPAKPEGANGAPSLIALASDAQLVLDAGPGGATLRLNTLSTPAA
ncbi:hypothetical protein Rsub_06415 [Raphidocelis subcapitata]|uniref:Uncharacterized protein n=1 Tax=Raphidocelis subcapitata TaxID=307507 RepID=A0A2V0P890_9CHLO|nr:hypothetical protein Rsub_06415 [Raphidocelis subcapitata]|eukprot:GBF93377.1 hypothetical protein Rsub_06415 [Raphidocelis subcapitata]